MLDAVKPIMAIVALWPTREFMFPEDVGELAQKVAGQFPPLSQVRIIQSDQPLPAEMPRLAMLDEGGRRALELAPGKITLRRSVQGPPVPVGELFEDILATLGPVQAWLAENLNLRVCRLGALMQFFIETRSSANDRIASYFLQSRALHGMAPHEVQISILTRLALAEGSLVNRWVRVQPLRTMDPGHADLAVKVEVDINTLAEDTHPRTRRDVEAFMEAVRRHVEEDIPVLGDEDFLA